MYSNVLVLLDGSDASEVVLQYVPSFVRSAGGQRVTLLKVADGRTESDEAYLVEQAGRLRSSWSDELVPIAETRTVTLPSHPEGVAHSIVDHTDTRNVDAIMLTTRGWSGADWWTTGSVAQHVLREASVPVFAARLGRGRFQRPGIVESILLPLDGSSLAEQAVPYAGHIAGNAGSQVTLLHIGDISDLPSEDYLESVKAKLEASGAEVAIDVQSGSPGQRIPQIAEDQNPDLIVMSSHGQSGPGRGAFGGVTERVIHGCRTPMLVIPHRAKAF